MESGLTNETRHRAGMTPLTRFCRVVSVLLVTGLVLYGTGQVWLCWGDSVGFDTPWGWAGVEVACGWENGEIESLLTKRLYVRLGDFRLSLLSTDCHCAICDPITRRL